MRALAQRRLVEATANGVKFVFAAPGMNFEARCAAAVPDPSPPALVVGGKTVYVRDAKGAVELFSGKAVPVCDQHAPEFRAGLSRASQLRLYLWIGHSLEAAGDANAHLRSEGASRIFGEPQMTTTYAEHVERELHEHAGLGEGDVHEVLYPAYRRAIGSIVEDLDAAVGNSKATGAGSSPSSPASS